MKNIIVLLALSFSSFSFAGSSSNNWYIKCTADPLAETVNYAFFSSVFYSKDTYEAAIENSFFEYLSANHSTFRGKISCNAFSYDSSRKAKDKRNDSISYLKGLKFKVKKTNWRY